MKTFGNVFLKEKKMGTNKKGKKKKNSKIKTNKQFNGQNIDKNTK